jgi:hypothetical protein
LLTLGGQVNANGNVGSAGQVLTSGGATNAYWVTLTADITGVEAGNGLTGGGTSGDVTLNVGAGNGISVSADAIAVTGANGITVTSVGVAVLGNTGLVVNATGVHINSSYIGTLTANNTSFVGSTSAANVVSNAQLQSNLTNYATLSGATFSGPVAVNANVTISGNLIVTGTTLYANVTNLDVADKNITIAKGAADAASTDGAGLTVDVSGASMRYTFASNTWEYNVGLIPSANNSWDIGLTGLRWRNVFANNIVAVNISGNGASLTSVNAATVGSNTAATLRSYSDSTAATAYTNAASDATTKAGTAYTNAVSYTTSTAFTRSAVTTFGANVILGSSGVSANGSFGTAGHVLHSNGTATYWAADDNSGGTVTSVATGNGMIGGPVTTTGTVSVLANTGIVANATGLFVLANTGIVANATGLFVNTTYVGTLSANNASFLGGVAAANYARSDSADTLTGLITINGSGLNGGIKLQNATGGRDWRVLQKDDGYFNITDETTAASRFMIEGTNAAAGSTFALGNFNFNVYGDVTAFYSSDARLKNNVVEISNALEKVKQIRGVEFDWSEEYIQTRNHIDKYFVKKHDVGVIAQEIEKVLPEVVSERDDGIKAVKYDRIVALLIEAVKELSKEIDELKDN